MCYRVAPKQHLCSIMKSVKRNMSKIGSISLLGSIEIQNKIFNGIYARCNLGRKQTITCASGNCFSRMLR